MAPSLRAAALVVAMWHICDPVDLQYVITFWTSALEPPHVASVTPQRTYIRILIRTYRFTYGTCKKLQTHAELASISVFSVQMGMEE